MGLREEIATAAYYLYERSGWLHGRDEEHWLEAERSVMGRLSEQSSGAALKKVAAPSPPAKKKMAMRRRANPRAKARP
jgi:hypothetical protein